MLQGSSWVLPYWRSLSFPHWCSWWRSWRNQRKEIFVCSMHELDMLVFALTWRRLHVSSGDQVAHATWSLADTQDSSSPTQYVPWWSAQLERNTDQKLDMKLCLLWIQFNNRTQVFHLREGKQDGHVTCLEHINLGGTWWNCWKVDNATFLAGFCLGIGKHERFVTTAEFRRSVIIPCMLLPEPRVLNGWLDSMELPPSMQKKSTEPPSIWSPGIVTPMTDRPIVRFPGLAISFFIGCF